MMIDSYCHEDRCVAILDLYMALTHCCKMSLYTAHEKGGNTPNSFSVIVDWFRLLRMVQSWSKIEKTCCRDLQDSLAAHTEEQNGSSAHMREALGPRGFVHGGETLLQ